MSSISGISGGFYPQMSASQGNKEVAASDIKQDATSNSVNNMAMDMSAKGESGTTEKAELATYGVQTTDGANMVASGASARQTTESQAVNGVNVYA